MVTRKPLVLLKMEQRHVFTNRVLTHWEAMVAKIETKSIWDISRQARPDRSKVYHCYVFPPPDWQHTSLPSSSITISATLFATCKQHVQMLQKESFWSVEDLSQQILSLIDGMSLSQKGTQRDPHDNFKSFSYICLPVHCKIEASSFQTW